MGRIDLSQNPCRRNIFDVYPIDKSETAIKAIRDASHKARNQFTSGKIVARDGTELSLTEADLNKMDRILLDPVARLKAEQFVHQAHFFSQDEELAGLLRQQDGSKDPLPDLLAGIQAEALLSLVRKALPQPAPPLLPDDLPPVELEPLELQLESLQDAILRDL